MKVTKLVTLTCALAIAALVGTEAHAGGRPDSSSRDWFGHISGGYGFTNGTTGDFLDDDWTFGGGAIYWPSSWRAGIALDINYGRFDLSNQALRAINDAIDADPGNAGEITGGDVQNWQFGLRGIWSLGANQSDGMYLTGGISWNDVTGRVTETGLVYYPPICDPWFWWCYPGGVGPGNFVVGKRSSDEFGWNVGLGYSFPNTDGRGYVELRYERVEFERESVEYIPLTFGYRW
jgi:opacity protein-like surface antigen